ncbi:hypothetical protein D3C80_2133710 [compost metagenome]
MAQLVNLLLDFALDTRLSEVGAIAKADKGIAPVFGMCVIRGQAHCARSQKCPEIRFL